MTDYVNKLKEKNILVVGFGKSGIAVIEFLHSIGTKISLQDSKTESDLTEENKEFLQEKAVECYLGSIPEELEAFDMLILSPGVPVGLPFIQKAKDLGAKIIGELELAYRIGEGKYLAITGTNGKTTTTTLVGEIVKNAGKDVRIVGNIGNPAVTEAMNATEDTWLVTEVSSFQLETIDEFKPAVSAILNLTPDHMDRHKTIENYGRIKARIKANQTNEDYFVINFDDKECLKYTSGTKAKMVPFSRLEPLKFGSFIKDDNIVLINEDEELVEICPISDLKIPGDHNVENVLAAVAITYFAGIDEKVITNTLRNFDGVEHRLEFVDEIDGIRFVNDSKGTNTDAAIKAIEAMTTPVVLIAGGYDKNADFSDFIDSFGEKVKYVVLMGATAGKIKGEALKKDYHNTVIVKDMKACVEEAFRIAEKGDTVLLSPACASWGMYNNFEERGNDFKECVKELKK